MINFIVEHWQTLALIWVCVGGLLFLGVLFFFYRVYLETKEEEEFVDDYYYPNHQKGGHLEMTLAFALIFGAILAIAWPFLLLILLGLYAYYLITEGFPQLLRQLTGKADDEGTDKNE